MERLRSPRGRFELYLNVNPFITPKKQPPRRSSKDHSDAVRDEVKKLKQAGAIKEVSILGDWPILWWSRKRIGNDECV